MVIYLIRGDWHRHKREPEAEAHFATVYPPKMVAAVLRSLRAELRENGVISSMDALQDQFRRCLTSIEEIPDEYREASTSGCGLWNDVSGGWLPTYGVLRALKE